MAQDTFRPGQPPQQPQSHRTLPDKRITDFIRKHHVMTLATSAGEKPYCANLFYAYDAAENCFVVTTDGATRHGAEAERNPYVAGSIVLETRIVGRVQGLQFEGTMLRPEAQCLAAARACYLKRFPYAAAMELQLWIIAPDFAKLTDNRLGFGKKLVWHADPKR